MTSSSPTQARRRLVLSVVGVAATALLAERDRVGPVEAKVFRRINQLPDGLSAPAWSVMQLGALGAAPAAAGVAWAVGERRIAQRLLVGGSATWALSKVFKRVVRRPRPAALLPDARRRGREASGLGYLSGHAGVAVSLGLAALPRMGTAGRTVTFVLMPLVGLSRIYVGAHLPLDVIGGASLGLGVDATIGLCEDKRLSHGVPVRGGH